MRKIPQVRGGAGIREQPAPPGDARIWPRPQPCPGPQPGATACCAAAHSGDGDTELQDITVGKRAAFCFLFFNLSATQRGRG